MCRGPFFPGRAQNILLGADGFMQAQCYLYLRHAPPPQRSARHLPFLNFLTSYTLIVYSCHSLGMEMWLLLGPSERSAGETRGPTKLV